MLAECCSAHGCHRREPSASRPLWQRGVQSNKKQHDGSILESKVFYKSIQPPSGEACGLTLAKQYHAIKLETSSGVWKKETCSEVVDAHHPRDGAEHSREHVKHTQQRHKQAHKHGEKRVGNYATPAATTVAHT